MAVVVTTALELSNIPLTSIFINNFNLKTDRHDLYLRLNFVK